MSEQHQKEHAAVHSEDFSSSEHDLRYPKASMWLSHLMQLFIVFQQVSLDFPALKMETAHQIAAKDHVITRHSMPMPNLTNGYGKAVFYFAFYPLGTRKSQAKVKGIPYAIHQQIYVSNRNLTINTQIICSI